MIHATVIGNLGADPELRYLQDGKAVLKMRIAASYKAGKEREFTTWVGVSLFGKRAEALSRMLAKGEKVCVRGTLYTRDHEGKTYVDLDADEVELLGKPAGDRYGTSGHGANAKHTAPVDDHNDPF